MDRIKDMFDLRWLVAAMLCAAAVLGLTHIPGEYVPICVQAHSLDKVEHVVAYGVIALCFMLSLRPRPSPGPIGQLDSQTTEKACRGAARRRPWLLPVILLLALAIVGALDELTQPFVNRVCDLWDFAADLTGVTAVGAVFLLKRLAVRPAPQCRQAR